MDKIEKSVYFCKRFNFKDEYSREVFGGHPKPGHLYKHIKDEDGNSFILIENNGKVDKIYAPKEQLEDPRFDFEFFEYNAENFYRANMIPHVEDPVALGEWLNKDEFFTPKEKALDKPDDGIDEEAIKKWIGNESGLWVEGMNEIKVNRDEGYLEMNDDVFINIFFNDLKCYFPDLYEAMMVSMGKINEYISSEKYDQKLPTKLSGLKQLIKKYKETNDDLDLTALYISIMNIFMEQNKDGEE